MGVEMVKIILKIKVSRILILSPNTVHKLNMDRLLNMDRVLKRKRKGIHYLGARRVSVGQGCLGPSLSKSKVDNHIGSWLHKKDRGAHGDYSMRKAQRLLVDAYCRLNDKSTQSHVKLPSTKKKKQNKNTNDNNYERGILLALLRLITNMVPAAPFARFSHVCCVALHLVCTPTT